MKIAIIRIRGRTHVDKKKSDTLSLLGLDVKQHCVIIEATPVINGMVQKIRDFVTWGEINEETEKLLAPRKKKKHYALHPPRGGFERKGIKMPFNKGGALGYRGEKINELLKRMA